jgi:hypothetical protein
VVYLQGNFNEDILNIDVEEINRNTRYFKSYLKDERKRKEE